MQQFEDEMNNPKLALLLSPWKSFHAPPQITINTATSFAEVKMFCTAIPRFTL
jgi:hypothetical protein